MSSYLKLLFRLGENALRKRETKLGGMMGCQHGNSCQCGQYFAMRQRNAFRKKDDPCSCDNCQYLKRFGYTKKQMEKESHDWQCGLCKQMDYDHSGYHCPKEKEWKLPDGGIVKGAGPKWIEIKTTSRSNPTFILRDNISTLIEHLRRFLIPSGY